VHIQIDRKSIFHSYRDRRRLYAAIIHVHKGYPKKVVAAMSGGVDSSTAAALLVEQGCEVTGVTLRMPRYGPEGRDEKSCCGREDTNDVRRVCDRLDIKLYVLDYRSKFEKTVLANFRREYERGRTPNPCVRCNNWLKFGALLDTARGMGAEYVATGHYVKKLWNPDIERYELHRGVGEDDQSYFLFGLTQSQLERALFPLGHMTKKDVRQYAEKHGIPTHNKPGSQDLCFLPAGEYRDMLRAENPELFEPGPIVHVSGELLGQHNGLGAYTVGQRKGLGVAWHQPLYVVGIDAEQNRLVVGEREYVMKQRITAGDLNWVSLPPPTRPLQAMVKIRYNHEGASGVITPEDSDIVSVKFDEPQNAPAPGQAAVFYEQDKLLGGGFIK
jgi:tRNA-specific 2-thiouridylase